MRIPTLLQKISERSAQPEHCTAIDIDLMLDYTRVLYADLLEWRSRLPVMQTQPGAAKDALPAIQEPTLAELTEAMQLEHDTEEEAGQTAIAGAGKAESNPDLAAAPDLKDIRSLISINDKYQIMSELFGNDRLAYEQALDYINQSGSESKALHWLREQLWITEEQTDAAQSFFEIVERYFSK